jgi:hypothetical protein
MSEIKKLCKTIDNLKTSILLYVDTPIDADEKIYIWHTQGDEKVRPSHAANDGKAFSQNDAPDTGNPGEDFGCRCWAEPYNSDKYIDQFLLTEIDEVFEKWTDDDFFKHYKDFSGDDITLRETGYLKDVVEYFDKELGVYDRVNSQIIDEAIISGEGNFIYEFNNTYDLGKLLPDFITPNQLADLDNGVLFSFGESTISGTFIGDARREEEFLVINGYITYDFYDEFADPYQLVESFDKVPFIDRDEAIDIIETYTDTDGKPYKITDRWQTKFNATIKIGF